MKPKLRFEIKKTRLVSSPTWYSLYNLLILMTMTLKQLTELIKNLQEREKQMFHKFDSNRLNFQEVQYLCFSF